MIKRRQPGFKDGEEVFVNSREMLIHQLDNVVSDISKGGNVSF